MAGGTGGGGDAFESGQDFGTDFVRERDVERVRQPLIGMPVEHDPVAEGRPEPLPEPVAQGAYLLHRREIAREIARRAEADGEQRAFRARTPAAFVPCPVDQRLERRAAANVESTDALGRIRPCGRQR